MTRYIIGIDLGTTNSAVSYVDTEKAPFSVQLFSIPQLIGSGRVESQMTLPSFCYLIAEGEWTTGSLALPWKEETHTFVGELAKSHGARVPTRLVQSAKSWLCNVAANRRDKILPIEAADVSQRLSPVEASARYLAHLKEAWNTSNPTAEFEEQEIILTVPASFDEVARHLTVEAARLAGLSQVTLLEEPQAAFYSWISHHEQEWQQQLKAGESILVCDIGGGTTDFSLIEVQQKEDQLTFQRMAVGNHLLLGGDNIDAALAHYIEQQLGIPSLSSTQWSQLLAEARSAKEYLLQDSTTSDSSYTVVLQGTGSAVVGGSVSLSLERSEVEELLLNGFFGQYELAEALQLRKSQGFRTMGLPYEDEPSMTKHLAHFLQQSHRLDKGVDYLLFNGGTLKPVSFQKAIYHSLRRWFPHKNPAILTSHSLDLAVARGAAYYGKARRGLGIKIGGGLPRTYYLEVEMKEPSGSVSYRALALLPRGSEEGESFEPQQTFYVRPNTPVAFHLLTSHVRLEDRQGEIVAIDEQEMHRLPPIQTVLRFGRRQVTAASDSQEKIPVHLGVRLTAIGTLELWLQSQTTEHKWDLEFQLRTATGQDHALANHKVKQDETFERGYLEEAKQVIQQLFSRQIKPEAVMDKLEEVLGVKKQEWYPSVLRGLWEPLLQCAPQRKISSEHEERWWNLAGFLLRPGFGFPLDDFRIKDLWKIILSELKSPQTVQHWICYRRIAGGLNKGQQMQIASEMMSTLLNKKSGKIEVKGKNELYLYSEKIRALASLERLDLPLKTRLGEAILSRIVRKEAIPSDYWALGRIGARHLVYGSIGQVVPKETCAKWVEQLIRLQNIDLKNLEFVVGQLARKTEHREINLPDTLIQQVAERFVDDKRLHDLLFQPQVLTQSEQEQVFGDRLPAGLMLEQ